LSYVKGLNALDHTSRSAIASRSAVQHNTTFLQLKMTNDGFPILPTPWNVSQYKKNELEEWFMLYVGQHYSVFPPIPEYSYFICMQN
jgi:hypothetical protein